MNATPETASPDPSSGRHKLVLAACILAFLACCYLDTPFLFGSNNNVEEVPLLYRLAGKAPYPGDSFVQFHTSHFTQVTPYLRLILLVTAPFGIDGLPFVFLGLHTLTLVLLYLSIRMLYRNAGVSNECLIAAGMVGLYLVTTRTGIIPASRWLFPCSMDPEFLVFPFLLLPIGLHAKGNHWWAGTCLCTANIFYPLYAIFIYGSLLLATIVRRRRLSSTFAIAAWYSLAVLPYLIFLYAISKGTGAADASLIIEMLRAPHHYHIYEIPSLPWLFFGFAATAIFTGLGIPPPASTGSGHVREISTHLLFLTVVLVLSSLIATCVRWPLLIQIGPYRIGIVVVVLAWVVLTASLALSFPGMARPWTSPRPQRLAAMGLAAVSLAILAAAYRVHTDFTQHGRGEVLEWIHEHTGQDDLFLNYSDIPIRTAGLRPVYFSFKTIPLTADAQRDWYARMRRQYGLTRLESPEDEQGVREARRLIFTSYPIDLAEAVRQTGAAIAYVITQQPETIRTIISINGLNRKEFHEDGLVRVFMNDRYTVFKVP